MALKRLPNDVQSLLSASAQVHSYKRAIEELVYNSLDAESTSIAIRVHIQESTIQVIDNGNGIIKHDLNVIAQRYMTSKLTDVATLKAAPKNYGYRGEFLANIVTVSQMVKVTSRHESKEETWAKTFLNGKEKKFAQMTTRPTKGTTVDIKGFLYNLKIQKRGIDPINEVQNIKLFLEQLSLVHNHISLSLRNDSQNEIVFKIHKKRDVYQTLTTLFDIDNGDILELQVEKHEYKVKGFIGKTDKDRDLHWTYLNGKYINNNQLRKIIDEYFKKYLGIKDQRRLKYKKNNDEYQLFNQNIPFYFIFVTCPYMDYDISYTPKQSIIEFKNWEQINKLLEKLVKFYIGDVNVKEIKNTENKLIKKEQINIKFNQDTRDQVKKIMNKILGSNSKKLGVSQLQNGVKGKMIKRNVKKKTKPSANIPKLFVQTNNKHNKDDSTSSRREIEPISELNIEQHIQETIKDLNKRKEHKTLETPKNHGKNVKKYKVKEKPMYKKKIELISSSTNETTIKHNQKLNTYKKSKVNNEFKYFKNTDSVYIKSKIVAQKAEKFFQHYTNIRKCHLENANSKRKKNTKFMQNKYRAINDNILLPTKTNKYIIDKYIINKLKTKSYKTTYDLVETVLKSQQEALNAAESNMSEEFYKKFHRRQNTLHSILKVPKRYIWTNKYITNEYSDTNDKKEILQYTNHIPAQYKTHDNEDNFSEYYLSPYEQKELSGIMNNISERLEFMDKNIHSQNQNIHCTQKESSYRTLSNPLKISTYDSHEHHKNEVFVRNDAANCYTINKRQNLRFIPKQSRDNFVTSNDFRPGFIKPFKSVCNKRTKIYDKRMRQTIDESLCTIEYSKSNENNYNIAQNDILANSVDYVKNKDYLKNQTNVSNENLLPSSDLHPVFRNTYTIHDTSNSLFEINIKRRHNIQSNKIYSIHNAEQSKVNNDNRGCKITTDDFANNSRSFNIVFVSKSQRSKTETSLDNNMIVEPLNVCETVFDEIGSDEGEFAFSFNENNRLNDSLYDNFENINGGIDERVKNELVKIIQGNDDVAENVSRHFSCAIKTKQRHVTDNVFDVNFQDSVLLGGNQNEITTTRIITTEGLPDLNTEGNVNAENINCNFEINNFNFKNRPRFVPKGMSQIFENCRTKTACNYNLNEDYYEDNIYNNFANDIRVNSEIYEPIIQNVEDLTTKNIHKFQNKVKKDNASLIFDETSLKEAKVLGQVDCKFIAAIMKKKSGQSKDATEYLILFDQHAAHERTRLEKNLADYINQERWASVAVDNIILKMSKDQILYLHNYKDKFTQLGLQWTSLKDNEITVNSIPEAILGKNPREVEKVIKAVKNLIVEEINVIKLQKGCVSLYPKSIMDLVFSEACRYAIKFGDQLTKNDCIELLNALSNCKTPYQCAHGRPVMAVIMDIKVDKRPYKIHVEKLNRFRQKDTRYP